MINATGNCSACLSRCAQKTRHARYEEEGLRRLIFDGAQPCGEIRLLFLEALISSKSHNIHVMSLPPWRGLMGWVN